MKPDEIVVGSRWRDRVLTNRRIRVTKVETVEMQEWVFYQLEGSGDREWGMTEARFVTSFEWVP